MMKEMNTSISNSTMILLGLFSLTIIGVDASNNFNHNDGARNSPYLYSEIQSLGFDVIYDDDEVTSSTSLDNEQSQNHMQAAYDYGYDISVSEFDTDDYEEPGREPSIVASSVLYDGECYVSSEAMMCNGGGGDNMIDRFIYDDLFDEDDEEVSDDDEDDDDNDGHSSMLSTASLRSKSTTRRERTRCHAGGTSTTSSKQQTTYTNNVVKLNNKLQLTFHPRSESFAFVRERVSAVASDASKAIKRA